MASNMKELYQTTIHPELQKSGKYANVMQIPKVEKIVLNLCLDHKAGPNKDTLKILAEELALLAGQRPVLTRARKSVANFKLREGMEIGAKVTLRGDRMYEFLERLIHSALPRIRDFRGISAKGFDGRGNFSLGLDDQTIFPEVNPDKVKKIQGLEVTIVTTANNNQEGFELLKAFGMPFSKN